MKRILFLLATVSALFALSISVAASETFEDLSRIYNNLSTYIYEPYFDDSQYFEEYKEQMDYAGKLLKDDSITQEEIDKGYLQLKTVYAKMMQDTYDYSLLPVLVEQFEQLDGSIFTEESWKKMVSTVDEIKTELNSPSIYYRSSDYTEESYREKTQAYIDKFETNYATAFNQLKLNDAYLDDDYTKQELNAYYNYVYACIDEDLMKDAESYDDLMDALDGAYDAFRRQNPSDDRINRAKAALDEAYLAMNHEVMDFTMLREEISTYRLLASSIFESRSFLKYQKEVELLETALEAPHFFYVPENCTAEAYENQAKAYLTALVAPAKAAYDLLLPIELVQELDQLCDQYRNQTTMEGLELKLGLLHNAVKSGDELLQSEGASKKDVEEAINNIKEAYKDLKTAEGFLTEEQSKIVKQDAETIKMILIFALISIFLSVAFACFLSKQRYGRIDWTK